LKILIISFILALMMNWRTYQNYFLLFAFAFKTIVLGTMLTLAAHNICLGQLLNDDVNWTSLVGKQRKRNDEPSQGATLSYIAAVPQTGNRLLRRCSILPVLFFLWLINPVSVLARISRLFNYHIWYTPDKIFIRYCALIR
jgi:hypothetical protein